MDVLKIKKYSYLETITCPYSLGFEREREREIEREIGTTITLTIKNNN
jgi:hypothetical protein